MKWSRRMSLGGADLHTRVSGTSDYPAADEDEAIAIGREIVAQWETSPTSAAA